MCSTEQDWEIWGTFFGAHSSHCQEPHMQRLTELSCEESAQEAAKLSGRTVGADGPKAGPQGPCTGHSEDNDMDGNAVGFHRCGPTCPYLSPRPR